MCLEMNITDFQNVRVVYLHNKITIIKDKLISWFIVPFLENTVTVAERADELKEDKISDQKSIVLLLSYNKS